MDKAALYKRLLAAGLTGTMALSGAYLIAPSEGYVQGTYLDPVGIVTSCYGHVDKTLKIGQKFTQDQCDKQFAQDLVKHDAQLASAVKVPYRSIYQHAALLSFTYNVGIGNLQSSTLLRRLNVKDHDGACNELSKWVYATQGGKLTWLRGLYNRRTTEYKWCMGEVPLEVKYDMKTGKPTGVVEE